MDYNNLSKEELIKIIGELEILNKELLKEKEQELRLNFSWTGNLGHWYWNPQSNKVTFNPLKITTLGYTEDEIPEIVGFEFFTDKLHPEDYPRAMEIMKDHLTGKSPVYDLKKEYPFCAYFAQQGVNFYSFWFFIYSLTMSIDFSLTPPMKYELLQKYGFQ